MNIAKLFERVEELESKNEVLFGKFKDAAGLLQKQNERIKELEAQLSDSSQTVSDSPSEDPFVSKHSTNMQLVEQAQLIYINRERGFATFRLPDGRGFVVSKSKWADPRPGFKWEDLNFDREHYEKLLIHKDVSVDEPVRMKCHVEERYDWKWRVQWRGKWGNIYTNGVLNEEVLNMHIRDRYPDGPPHTKGRNSSGELLEMELELMVLPWYVTHANSEWATEIK